jgi:hypothetical protein
VLLLLLLQSRLEFGIGPKTIEQRLWDYCGQRSDSDSNSARKT